MPKLALQLKATLENVTGLKPCSEDFILMIKVKCTSCQEEHPKTVGLCGTDENEIKGSRGDANLVMSCSFCKREMSATLIEPKPNAGFFTPYEPPLDKGFDFRTLCTLDVRGLEPIGFEFEGTWNCAATESKTTFRLDFEEDEWTDYDEKAELPVSIMELESRWVRG